jgi:flagellar biosynthesis/type III secretory pathway M-ring protein FliF/YscJ
MNERKGPPIPSAYALADDPDEVLRREKKRERAAGSLRNEHLNLDRIEAEMESSVARQMLRMLRENPELAAQIVKGLARRK